MSSQALMTTNNKDEHKDKHHAVAIELPSNAADANSTLPQQRFSFQPLLSPPQNSSSSSSSASSSSSSSSSTSASTNALPPPITGPAPTTAPAPPLPVVHKDVKHLGIIIFTGTFMAIIAGYINGVTILSTFGNPVSHVSGTTSKIGIYLVQGSFTTKNVMDKFIQAILLIFFFLLGSTMTGCVIRAQSFKLGRYFGIVMMFESVLLCFSAVFYAGDSMVAGQYAAAMACGLQNAMATRFSGAVVRTTHMTGIMTDIGLLMGNWMRWGETTNLWRLKVFLPLFFGFLGGGSLGALAFLHMGTDSLFIPALFTMAGGVGFFVHDVLWGQKGWCIEFVPSFILKSLGHEYLHPHHAHRQKSQDLKSPSSAAASASSTSADSHSVVVAIVPTTEAAPAKRT